MARLTNIVKEEDPCWKGYQQVGMKTKNGKQVPNCVPESVNEAYVPSNIKDFAKRKGVTQLVNTVAGWAEKVGKKISGGTAIGKNYDTLVLDMTYNGSEIYINCETERVELYDELVRNFQQFKKVYDEYQMDESINESKFSDIDIIAQEAKDFKDFVKEFYTEFKDFPKTKDSLKWLEDVYKGRTKMEGLERVAQGLPQTEEEPITEKQLKGLEGISPNQTLDKISNADKLKIIKSPGNIINFFVPDWAKGSRNFWQVIGTGKIKKNMSGEFGLEGKGPMKSSPTFKTMDDLIDGVDWKSMEQTRRFNEGSPKHIDSLTENSLSDLEKKLKSHDWWYAYSDDNRKYKSGETNWFEITKMIKGMKGNKEAEKLWNKYSPKDFNYSFKELSETQLDEGIFKIGVKHIIPLIPTGYAPNDPKYKMDLKVLRNMLNNFYKERGYEKVILPSF
jgi:hypothetical protein